MDHTRLFNRVVELRVRDLDVGDVETVLSHFGAEEDEAEVSVRGDGAALIAFGEEAVFTMLQMVAETSFECSHKGSTHV